LSYTPAPRDQKGRKIFRSRQRASRGTGNDSGSRRQGGGGGEPRWRNVPLPESQL